MKWELAALEILARNPTVPVVALRDCIDGLKKCQKKMIEVSDQLTDYREIHEQDTRQIANMAKQIIEVTQSRDGFKALADSLFDECLEALGTPDNFSLAELPWQLRTMREKIANLRNLIRDIDTDVDLLPYVGILARVQEILHDTR